MSSVFITGSTRGIGREIAKTFVDAGWDVAVHGRSAESVTATVEYLGGNSSGFSFDITDSESLQQSLFQFSKTAGQLDCVIHCAGVMKDAPLGMITSELAQEVISTNITASINVVQFSARIMTRKGSGSILLFNSVVGIDGAAGQSLYSSSKAALTGLVLSAAKELGPRGIRVNALAPGLIQTDLISGLSQEKIDALTEDIPLKRVGRVEDIAPIALFLAGPGGSYITGQTIRVDGGFRP